VKPPSRRGFGSRLLESALKRELGGTTTIQHRPEGVVCEIAAPLRARWASRPF